ncbi:hypothetical protein [Defluviicoccus vanus]|nr:hypothetical protein [Defluviicoccus vanus]
MLKVAALAFLPLAAMFFGMLVLAIIAMPGTVSEFEAGAILYYGAAALSVALAVPATWLVARRMLTRRERHLLDVRARHSR